MKTKKAKRFSLQEEYRNSFKHIRESKKFIYIIAGIFFLFALIAFFIPAPQAISDRIFDFIKELFEKTEGMSQFELMKFIIANNVQSTFFGIILGILLGIFPVASAIINGYLVGFVSFLSVDGQGVLSLWRLLPHGIFELPAVFISLGLGLRLGASVFSKKTRRNFGREVLNSLKAFLFVVIPLLVIAGIIEGMLISLF
jgi:stage II sporulation protein M